MVDQRKHILVVDDDEQVLLVWCGALDRHADQWSVQTARDGYEALKLIRQTGYDLIVTDLRMPLMTGCELTKAIRSLAGDVPVVWFTAFPDPGVVARAAQLSVRCLLTKPLHVSQIRQVVAYILEQENHRSRLSPAGPTLPT